MKKIILSVVLASSVVLGNSGELQKRIKCSLALGDINVKGYLTAKRIQGIQAGFTGYQVYSYTSNYNKTLEVEVEKVIKADIKSIEKQYPGCPIVTSYIAYVESLVGNINLYNIQERLLK